MRISQRLKLFNRPHLISEDGARELVPRLKAIDDQVFQRHSRFDALLRKVGLKGTPAPAVVDTGDLEEEVAAEGPPRPDAYSRHWLGEPDGVLEWGWVIKDGVAVMEINTPLVERGYSFCGEFYHGYDTISQAVREADADSRVRALFIHYDTPGGVCAPGINDLTAELQARRGGKPLWAFCDMACSAGYWLAAQADRVIAPKVSAIGSIGVVCVYENWSAHLERLGVEIQTIQFGAYKTEGAFWQGLSDEGRAEVQAQVDELGEDFLAAVAAGRGEIFTAADARATEARVYMGEHRELERSALALGLIDAVMPEHEAFAALVKQVSEPGFSTSPPDTGGTSAASTDVASPAARAAPTTESAMKLLATFEALARKAKAEDTPDDDLASQMRELLDKHDAAKSEGEEEDPDAEDDEEDAAAGDAEAAEGDEEDAPAEDDEEEDAPAAAAAAAANGDPVAEDRARAQAIINLPEAKGREQLAQKLAFDGMSVEQAKATLAAAPKGSSLGERMTGRDVNLTTQGGKQSKEEAERAADFAAAGVKRRVR